MNNYGSISDYSSEHKRIIKYVNSIRSKKKSQKSDWKEAAEWHLKYSYLNGKKSLALTITLSPVGCQWARTGGCTMCGEFEGADTRPKVLENAQFHISQFTRAISNPEVWKVAREEQYPITWLRILQEGNFLNPKEMNRTAQETILQMAIHIKDIKRITIETRPQFINKESVSMLNKVFKDSNVELEIGMGVEAVNDVIRNICINKGDSIKDFERAVNLLNANNIKPLAYILVKPPFLTEREAIDEAVSTAEFATDIGFKRISFEPMSIHAYSLVDALFQCGCYKVPWLWSVIEIAKRCAEGGIVEFGIGGIGFYPLPTTFSHNYCPGKSIKDNCNDKVIKAIVKYNKTHNIEYLKRIKPCKACYDTWLQECSIQNNESLNKRITVQLNQVKSIIPSYKPQQLVEGDAIKSQTFLASGSQSGLLENKDYYAWMNREINEADLGGIGITQSVATTPLFFEDSKKISKNNSIIRDFHTSCLKLLTDALKNNEYEVLKWLINDTPQSLREDYLRKLPSVFWQPPVFFRTDESEKGKVLEIQCPGSSWGELELLYNFYSQIGYQLRLKKPSQNFVEQLVRFLKLKDGESPLVFYLTDNASIPAGVRYFISQTRLASPPIKYWGIDKYPSIQTDNGHSSFKQLKAIDSNFVRAHYYLELFGECDFNKRLQIVKDTSPYDLPPMSLFDQKATLVLPFWDKTKHLFTNEIRDLIAFSTPLIDNTIHLENNESLTVEEFASLPHSQRKYYLKYAGTDASINWGSRSIRTIGNIGREKLIKLLYEKIEDFKYNNRPWILQKESKGAKENVLYFDSETNSESERINQNSKYSFFYGPYNAIGGIISYRKLNIVHGQPDTTIRLIDFNH